MRELKVGVLAMNDAGQFTALVAALAISVRRRRVLGYRAREGCIASYSHDAMLDAYLNLIGEVTAGR